MYLLLESGFVMKKKILLITIFLVIPLLFLFNCTVVSAVDTVLYDEDYSLEAGEYSYYGIDVTSVPVHIHIELTCDDDINLYIFNDTEATKWDNSETAVGYIYNDVSSLDIYQILPTVDTWWVYLDNTDSVVTSKSGHITITAVDVIPTTTTTIPTTTTTTTTEDVTTRPGETGSSTGEVTVTVPMLSYRAWSVETTKDNVKVNVIFLCDGCDINFFVANDANFKAWQGGSTAAQAFIYNDKIEFEETITLPEADTWWFVLDNTDSLLTSKTVTISISVVSSAYGFELLTVPIIVTSIIIYRRKRRS